MTRTTTVTAQADQEKKMVILPKGEGIRIFSSNLSPQEKLEMVTAAKTLLESKV